MSRLSRQPLSKFLSFQPQPQCHLLSLARTYVTQSKFSSRDDDLSQSHVTSSTKSFFRDRGLTNTKVQRENFARQSKFDEINRREKQRLQPFREKAKMMPLILDLEHRVVKRDTQENAVLLSEINQEMATLLALKKNPNIKKITWCYQELLRQNIEPDVTTINLLLTAYGSILDQTRAINIFTYAMKHNVQPTIETYNLFFKALLHNYPFAKEVFDRDMKKKMIKPNSLTYKHLLRSCSLSAKHWEDVFDLVQSMKEEGLKPDVFVYNYMIRALCNNYNCEAARTLCKKMESLGVCPNIDTYNVLIKGFASTNNHKVCLELLHQLEQSKSLKPTVVHYNMVLRVLGKCEQITTMLETFENMDQRVAPDTVTYTSIISVFCQHHKTDKVLEYLEKMKQEQIQPNTITYTQVLKCLGNAGRWEHCIDLYNNLKEEHQDRCSRGEVGAIDINNASKSHKHGLVLDVYMYNTLLKILGNENQFKLVYQLLQEMRDFNIKTNAITYEVLCRSCVQHDHRDRAMEFFNEMSNLGIEPLIRTEKLMEELLKTKGGVRDSQWFAPEESTADAEDVVTSLGKIE